MSEKNLKILGWIGTTLSVIMYASYFPQIIGNLSVNKTPFIHPLPASVNRTTWTAYGQLNEKRYDPLSAANLAGDLIRLTAAITLLL